MFESRRRNKWWNDRTDFLLLRKEKRKWSTDIVSDLLLPCLMFLFGRSICLFLGFGHRVTIVFTINWSSRRVAIRVWCFSTSPHFHLNLTELWICPTKRSNKNKTKSKTKKKWRFFFSFRDEVEELNNEDRLISIFDEHEESVYVAEWASNDPWLLASLSYDGRLILNRVPKKEKFQILLRCPT